MRYTVEEAAKIMRKTERWLNEWLRANPVDSNGEPFFTPAGRDKILLSTDITRIEHALRGQLKCRYTSGRRAPVKRRIMKSGVPTSESEWNVAAELLNEPSLKIRNGRPSAASRSMGNIQRPSLSLVDRSPRS